MSKRIKIDVNWLSYEADGSTNDPKDSEKLMLSVSETAASEVFRRKEQIANGVVDQDIELPSATSTDYLMISTDQEITVKLNGSSDALTLTPKTAGKKAPVLFLRATITELSISNASGSVANVDILAANV